MNRELKKSVLGMPGPQAMGISHLPFFPLKRGNQREPKTTNTQKMNKILAVVFDTDLIASE